jgi:molybdopterin molybdotransferase
LTVCKTGEQGSGILRSMSQANCFIVLTADQTRVEAGSTVIVQPFASWL